MLPKVYLFATNAFLCSGCAYEFHAHETVGRHPDSVDFKRWGLPVRPEQESCPNAGKSFSLPEAKEVTNEPAQV